MFKDLKTLINQYKKTRQVLFGKVGKIELPTVNRFTTNVYCEYCGTISTVTFNNKLDLYKKYICPYCKRKIKTYKTMLGKDKRALNTVPYNTIKQYYKDYYSIFMREIANISKRTQGRAFIFFEDFAQCYLLDIFYNLWIKQISNKGQVTLFVRKYLYNLTIIFINRFYDGATSLDYLQELRGIRE